MHDRKFLAEGSMDQRMINILLPVFEAFESASTLKELAISVVPKGFGYRTLEFSLDKGKGRTFRDLEIDFGTRGGLTSAFSRADRTSRDPREDLGTYQTPADAIREKIIPWITSPG